MQASVGMSKDKVVHWRNALSLGLISKEYVIPTYTPLDSFQPTKDGIIFVLRPLLMPSYKYPPHIIIVGSYKTSLLYHTPPNWGPFRRTSQQLSTIQIDNHYLMAIEAGYDPPIRYKLCYICGYSTKWKGVCLKCKSEHKEDIKEISKRLLELSKMIDDENGEDS
jgi:hypothetical protein